jgi:diguanylate cyclase (GGDEF)-like protein/PAS domain S-box-containing protein
MTDLKDIMRELSVLVRRVNALEESNEALNRELGRYIQVFNNAQEGVILLDENQKISAVNDTITILLGYKREELIGINPDGLYDREHVDVYSASRNHLSFEARFRAKDGRLVPMLFNRTTFRNDDRRVSGFAAFLIDLTELTSAREDLRKSEERYRELSLRDSLTSLFNTRYLYQQLDELTYRSRLSGTPFSLIFMDMDNFKKVVDTFGHLNGSRALQEVAETIRSCLDDPSFGVAYGGDEFVVVLPECGKSMARDIAEQIQFRMKASTYLTAAGHHVKLKASFGLATCPDDGDNRTDLLALADQAMFRVKEGGKDGIAVCKSDSDTDAN